MQREIKLRAWDKLNKRWVYFQIGQTWSEVVMVVYHRIIVDGGVFCRYIGINDKNGKEIYEGDILKYFSSIGSDGFISEVRYDSENAAFMPFNDMYFIDGEQGVGFNEDKGFTIIGNINENPELINS